ncbi:MAG: DUF4111 domain-containing protein [Dehalococcoidales bacterium]|nr:MAG: DUF4111 domain-containing protein [Dehalococcoidales bacterium]
MHDRDLSTPRRFNDLPQDVQTVCTALRDGLRATLNDNLYGIYLYGAMVFPDMKDIHDIDFHAVVKRPLTTREKTEVRQLHKELAEEYPVVGDDLDGWYILLNDAQRVSPPQHQVYPDLFDNSWALHRAHMRAGYCIVLYGPEPDQVFPVPAWSELMAGLENERIYIERHLSGYPDYCVLNLCRLLYSYKTKEVVVSKYTAAKWALDNFNTWRTLIEAALRSYAGEISEEDKRLLESETERFYHFICNMIEDINTV